MKVSFAPVALVALSGSAFAQQSVSIDLANVRIQNGVAQSRSSNPATISPAHRYAVAVDGMVRGVGGVLGLMFSSPTPLAQVMETLAPGSSQNLSGTFDNCSGAHPISLQGQTTAGSTVILGVTVNYSLTLTTGIDSSNYAYFSFTDVVLTPSTVTGYLLFTSGAATVVRQEVCLANCDESTAAPVLNVADFTCFLTRFASGDAYANCDCSTTAPALNVADFTCFLSRFAQGCP
jgi:hypothetical protein